MKYPILSTNFLKNKIFFLFSIKVSEIQKQIINTFKRKNEQNIVIDWKFQTVLELVISIFLIVYSIFMRISMNNWESFYLCFAYLGLQLLQIYLISNQDFIIKIFAKIEMVFLLKMQIDLIILVEIIIIQNQNPIYFLNLWTFGIYFYILESNLYQLRYFQFKFLSTTIQFLYILIRLSFLKEIGLSNCSQQDINNQNKPSTSDITSSDSKNSTSSNLLQNQYECDFIKEKITCIVFSFLLYIIINLKHYISELVNSVQFVNKNNISSLPSKKQFYRACLNLVPDGLILVGQKGEIQYFNEYAKSILQCEESEILSTIYQLALVDSNGVFNQNVQGQDNNKGQNGTPVNRSSQAGTINNNDSLNESIQKQKNSFQSFHSKIKSPHDISRQRSLDSKVQPQRKLMKQNTATFQKQSQYIQSKTINHSSFRPQPSREASNLDNLNDSKLDENEKYPNKQKDILNTQPCNITQEIIDKSVDQIFQNKYFPENTLIEPKNNNLETNEEMNCIVINFECDKFNISNQNPNLKSQKQLEQNSYVSKSEKQINETKEEIKGNVTQSKRFINLNGESQNNQTLPLKRNLTQIKQEYIEDIDLNKCKNIQDIFNQILNKNKHQINSTQYNTTNLNTNNYLQKSQQQIPSQRKIQDKTACKNRSQTLDDQKYNQNIKSLRQKKSQILNVDYLIQFQTLISNKKVNNTPLQRTSLFEDTEKQQANDEIVEVKVKLKEKVLLIQLIKLQFETYVDNVKEDKASILIVMKDITKQQLYQELEEQTTVSHELRTPLNCTVMMLQQLKWHISSDLSCQYLKPSLNSCNLLLNLINDILDLAQINAGKFSFSFQKFRLEKLLKETINLLSQKATLKGIEINLEHDKRIPKHVISDPHRLRQILVNLIGNSLKFTKKGHIILRTSLISMQPVRMNVSVIDTGIGIPKDKQREIFSTFGKVNDNGSKKLNSNGCGLGLNISNQLAKGIGPNDQGIKLESEVDKGSTFSFCLEDKQLLKKTENYIGKYRDDLNLQKKKHKRSKKNKVKDLSKSPVNRVSLKQLNSLTLNFSSVLNLSQSKFQSKDRSSDQQYKKLVSNPKTLSNIISQLAPVTNKTKISGKNAYEIIEDKNHKNGAAGNKYETNQNSAKIISSNLSIPEIVGEESPSHGNASKSNQSKTQSMSRITKSDNSNSSSSSSSSCSSSRSSNINGQKKESKKGSSAIENNLNNCNNPNSYESYSSIRFDKSVLDKNQYQKGSLLMSPTHHPKHGLSSLNVGSCTSIYGNRKLSFNNFIPQTPIRIIQTKQEKKPFSKAIPQVFENRLNLASLQEKNAKINIEQNNSQLQHDQMASKNRKSILAIPKHLDPKTIEIKELDCNSISQLKEVVNQQQRLIHLKKIEDCPEDIRSSQSSLEDINKIYQNEFENDIKDPKSQTQMANINSDIYEKDFNITVSQQAVKSKLFLKRSFTAEADEKKQKSLIYVANDSKKFNRSKKESLAWFKYYYDSLLQKCKCPKILIVDDNQFNVHALGMFLSQYVNTTVDVAFDGEEALEKVLSYYDLQTDCGCREYDLIFMDIEMPFLDGFQTSDQINKFFAEKNHNTRTVIIACTAHNDIQESKLTKYGIQNFITKPIKKKDLESAIVQWVNQYQFFTNLSNSNRQLEYLP